MGSYWLSWIHNFESFMVNIITWLTITEYLCHKWPRICSICCHHNPVLSSFMTYHRVCNTTGVTCGARQFSLPEHLSSPQVFSGVRIVRSLVMFSALYIIVCPFVLFLVVTVISVFGFAASDYPPLVSSSLSCIASFK